MNKIEPTIECGGPDRCAACLLSKYWIERLNNPPEKPVYIHNGKPIYEKDIK